MTNIDPRLRTELGQRADRVSVTGDVAARAIEVERRNHRRRATAGAIGAALALAVSVPVVVASMQRGAVPVVPATTPTTSAPTTATAPTASPTAASPTPTPTTTAPAPSYLELSDAYAAGDTLRIGGRTIQLERGTLVKAFAVLDGGGAVLTSSMGDETSEHEILDPSGNTVRRIDAPTSDTPGHVARWAVSPDGGRILFSTGENATVFDASGKVVATRSSTGEASAIVGDRAYLRGGDLDPSSASTEWNLATGGTRELPSGVRAVSRDGRLAAINWKPTAYDDYRTCWAIIDLEDGLKKTLERCGGYFIPQAFSASGTYVVGQNYIDGGDVYNLAVARAEDGAFVIGGADRADWFLGWTMRMSEDEKTVLVARNTTPEGADRATEVTIVRCSLDLRCTTLQPERSFQTIGWPPYVVGR